LEFGTALGVEKLEWWGYPSEKEVWRLSSAVWLQSTNVTDRQPSRRTPDDIKDRAYA